jgi:hypothetical protein
MSEKADPVVCGCGCAATTNNRSTFLRIAVKHRLVLLFWSGEAAPKQQHKHTFYTAGVLTSVSEPKRTK